MLRKILDQERTPVWTGISLLTTVFVEAVIIIFHFTHVDGWNVLGAFALTGLVVLIGFVLNCIAGRFATEGGEYMGGLIAATRIAIWILTIVAILGIHDLQNPTSHHFL